jgi:hypothetical protein
VKKFLLTLVCFIVVAATLIGLAACNRGYNDSEKGINPDEPSYDESGSTSDVPGVSERKIVYTAHLTISTDDLEDAIEKINALTQDGEWFDSESIGEESAVLVFRVKSDRLDAYLEALKTCGKVYHLVKNAEDVSLHYYNLESRIESLEAEYDTLDALLASADDTDEIADILAIRKRMTEIDVELRAIRNAINVYDSQIENSIVTITVIQNYQPETPPPFGQRIAKLFKDAWKALVVFFKWIVMAITATFPFLLVFGALGVGVFFIVRAARIKNGTWRYPFRRKKKAKATDAATKIEPAQEAPSEEVFDAPSEEVAPGGDDTPSGDA